MTSLEKVAGQTDMSSVTPSLERIGGSLIGNELAMQFASETIAKNSSKFVDRKAPLDPIRFEIFELKNELFVNIFAVLRFAELGRLHELEMLLLQVEMQCN